MSTLLTDTHSIKSAYMFTNIIYVDITVWLATVSTTNMIVLDWKLVHGEDQVVPNVLTLDFCLCLMLYDLRSFVEMFYKKKKQIAQVQKSKLTSVKL